MTWKGGPTGRARVSEVAPLATATAILESMTDPERGRTPGAGLIGQTTAAASAVPVAAGTAVPSTTATTTVLAAAVPTAGVGRASFVFWWLADGMPAFRFLDKRGDRHIFKVT